MRDVFYRLWLLFLVFYLWHESKRVNLIEQSMSSSLERIEELERQQKEHGWEKSVFTEMGWAAGGLD